PSPQALRRERLVGICLGTPGPEASIEVFERWCPDPAVSRAPDRHAVAQAVRNRRPRVERPEGPAEGCVLRFGMPPVAVSPSHHGETLADDKGVLHERGSHVLSAAVV